MSNLLSSVPNSPPANCAKQTVVFSFREERVASFSTILSIAFVLESVLFSCGKSIKMYSRLLSFSNFVSF